jgi:hypothetical protein
VRLISKLNYAILFSGNILFTEVADRFFTVFSATFDDEPPPVFWSSTAAPNAPCSFLRLQRRDDLRTS